jgi:hypothetical protein
MSTERMLAFWRAKEGIPEELNDPSHEKFYSGWSIVRICSIYINNRRTAYKLASDGLTFQAENQGSLYSSILENH